MAFAPVFQRPFSATFDRRAAAATPWWLSGGVAAANVVAVYQPKGAASLAASYTNLANPGTYNAAPGVAPTFNAATGWTFNGTDQYLTTGVTPANNQTWSLIVRFSDVVSGFKWLIAGAGDPTGPWFGIEANRPDNAVLYANGDLYFPAPALTAGVLTLAGTKGYRNGSPEAGSIAAKAGSFAPLFIGAANYNTGGPFIATFLACKIQAVAIYNTTLTAPQVAAISSAMSLL